MKQQRTIARLEWIDIAKGVCIALVVLGHTVDWYGRNFIAGDTMFWTSVSVGLRSLRMPLFFMISGMLAAGKIGRPLRELWDKTGGLYLLYVLWTGIYCLKLALPGGREGLPYPGLEQIAAAFALPVILWYIWALPVFYMIAWSLERLLGPKSIYAFLPMLGLSIGAPWIGAASESFFDTPLFMVHSQPVAFNLLWFYVGLKQKQQIIGIVASATLPRLVIASVLAVVVAGATLHFGIDWLPILSTPFLLWAALEWLGHSATGSVWTRPLLAIGRKTLPIYLLHTFVLTAMTLAVNVLHADTLLPYAWLPLQIVLPIMVTTLLLFGCILAGRILDAVRLGFLVRPIPSPFRR